MPTAVNDADSGLVSRTLIGLGDWAIFAVRAWIGVPWSMRSRTLLPIAFNIGVRSLGVVILTGVFIGAVLAVQAYGQFRMLRLETWLGSIINLSVIRELGPVLAATMLAGRVGSAMAAELATMRVTEQIDAVACLGVDPVHHLVSPRLLACASLIPLLTVMANLAGVIGGALVSTHVYHIDPHLYWQHGTEFGGVYDVLTGLLKSAVFGAVIALVSCHRGFQAKAGAAGVGQAATEAFVISFVTILILDFFMALFFNSLSIRLWPNSGMKMGE